MTRLGKKSFSDLSAGRSKRVGYFTKLHLWQRLDIHNSSQMVEIRYSFSVSNNTKWSTLSRGLKMEEEEDIEFSQLLDEVTDSGLSNSENLDTDEQSDEFKDAPNWGLWLILGAIVLILILGIACILYLLNPQSTT